MSSGNEESYPLALRIPSSVIRNAVFSGTIQLSDPRHSEPMISLSIPQGLVHSPMLKHPDDALDLIFSANSDPGYITLSLVDVQVVSLSSNEEGGSKGPERGSTLETKPSASIATRNSRSRIRRGDS